jgi:hypothetical protein
MQIPAFDFATEQQPLLNLEELLLTDNGLKTWEDVEHLGTWMPKLAKLRLRGNPICEGEKLEQAY